MNYSSREITARADLARSRAHDEGPVDAQEVARTHGIKIRFASFSNDGPQFVADHVGAFFDPEEDAIYVNKNLSGLEKNFVIALELGKALLHETWARNEATYAMTLRTQDHDSKTQEQIDAELFAHALLVPKKDLTLFRGHLPLSRLVKAFALPEKEFYRAASLPA